MQNVHLSNINSSSETFPRTIYKFKSVTFVIICILASMYTLQDILFYVYFNRKGKSWGCLLSTLGSTQASKIVYDHHFHRIITSIFLHASFSHLASNVISLALVGFYLEAALGNNMLDISLFFLSGIYGNLTSLMFSSSSQSVGASGAIIGLCGFFFLSFFFKYNSISEQEKRCYILFLIVLGLNLFAGFFEGNKNIDSYGHIGGFLGGVAGAAIVLKKRQVLSGLYAKYIYIASIIYLIVFPILSMFVLYMRDIKNIKDYICIAN